MVVPDDIRLKLDIYSAASGLVHATWCNAPGDTIDTVDADDPAISIEGMSPCDCGIPDLIRRLNAIVNAADGGRVGTSAARRPVRRPVRRHP